MFCSDVSWLGALQLRWAHRAVTKGCLGAGYLILISLIRDQFLQKVRIFNKSRWPGIFRVNSLPPNSLAVVPIKTEAFKLRIQSVYFFFLLIFKKITLEFRIRRGSKIKITKELNRFPISFHT